MVSKPPAERAQGISQRSDNGCGANFPRSNPSNATQMQDPRVHPTPTHVFPLTIRTSSSSKPPNITRKTSNTRNNGAALRAAYRTPTYANQASRLEQIPLGQHALISPRAAQPAGARVCTIRDGDAQSHAISRMGMCRGSSGREAFWFRCTALRRCQL